MIRRIFAASAVVLAILAGIIGYRTIIFAAVPPVAARAAPDAAAYAIDVDAAARHLSRAIQFHTISITPEEGKRGEFEHFQAWMRRTYPAFHAVAKSESVNGLSLLYTWQGADPALAPMLLLAHQDVVPIAGDTRDRWRDDPFGGAIHDGAVWGRGAMDDKGSLVALLEAANYLATRGYRPQRSIMLAFGHDEEIGSRDGAQRIAALLKQRGVSAWFVLDEGMAAIDVHPVTGGPVAMIGISERGSGLMRVVARSDTGHASMPSGETSVALVAQAVARIDAMPIERRLAGGPAQNMMRALAPELPLASRVALANEWLFAPAIRARFAVSPAADALLGTTVAPTVIRGGDNPGMLPGEARALINFRIHPRDNPDALMRRARRAVRGLDGITLEWTSPPLAPSAVASTTSSSYALIASASRAALPQAAVAPGLVLAGTDARHYEGVAENAYRYQPLLLSMDDLDLPHGVNERMSLANLERMIRFYIVVMQAGATP